MRSLRHIILLLLAVAVSACGAVAPGTKLDTGGTVTRVLTSEPATLDPAGPAGSGQNVILPYVLDTLVYRDVDNSYKPYLAERWTAADDGMAVTFKLRKDVVFQDGTALDAQAVVFSMQRLKAAGAKSPLASGMAPINDIEAVDNLTVRFVLSAPSATLLSTLSMPYAGIISPAAAKQEGDAFGQKPVGTGAFKLLEWTPGVSITLARNPAYRWAPPAVKNQAAPHIEKAIFKIIPDATTQLAALQAGEADIIFVNQSSQIAALQQDKNVRLMESALNSLIYLGFNCRKAPFDDVRVRQALSHAVNKSEIVQTALGGVGKEAFAPLSPTIPGFDASLKSGELAYDPATSKALLGAAGFTQGADGAWMRGTDKLSVVLLTSSRAPNDAIATVLQSQLKAIGVALEIKLLDSTAAMSAMSKGQYDLMVWRYDWNDPDVLNIYLGSANIPGTNRVFYSNKDVDALLAKAGRTMDDKARNQLYLDAQKLIMADAPWQPLYVPVDYTAIRARVQNVVMGPMGRVLLNDATVVGK